MSAYMRDQFAFLGIPAPERRQLSREFLKSTDKTVVDWAFVFECWRQPEREFQYLALDYLKRAKDALTAVDIHRLRKIAVQKSWWDTIDSIDRIVGDIALRYPEVNDGNYTGQRVPIIAVREAAQRLSLSCRTHQQPTDDKR